MSSYWDDLERLISQEWPDGITEQLIAKGWAPESNRAALDAFFEEHSYEYAEDGDEWNTYCACGKWLERDAYEMPDHLSSVLEDTGLLTPGNPWIEGPA